jgi:endoglycosylceramidase
MYTVAEQVSWGILYNNATVSTALSRFWRAVGTAFNTSDYLLGFELINEPQAGNLYSDPLLYLIAGDGDRQNLAPLYETVYQSLRTTDARHIVFYEPAVHETVLRQGTGFLSGPGGVQDNAKQAFAYHLYCFNQNATGDITNVTDCASNLDAYWAIEIANKKQVAGGSFLTEFGAVGPNPSSAEVRSQSSFGHNPFTPSKLTVRHCRHWVCGVI